MVDLDRSERQVHKMMDWMHSMKEEVLELKKAQEEEVTVHVSQTTLQSGAYHFMTL